MAAGDLSVIGPQASIPRYLVSGGTNILAGEPLHSLGVWTSGLVDVNTFVLAAADTPVIATHRFGGVALKRSLNVAAGTVREQFLPCACPVPSLGRIRGRAETVASVDTLTELALLIGDLVLIDYDATGAADGGQLYTIKEAGSADTSGLEIVYGATAVSGNRARYWLDVTVQSRAYRNDVS